MCTSLPLDDDWTARLITYSVSPHNQRWKGFSSTSNFIFQWIEAGWIVMLDGNRERFLRLLLSLHFLMLSHRNGIVKCQHRGLNWWISRVLIQRVAQGEMVGEKLSKQTFRLVTNDYVFIPLHTQTSLLSIRFLTDSHHSSPSSQSIPFFIHPSSPPNPCPSSRSVFPAPETLSFVSLWVIKGKTSWLLLSSHLFSFVIILFHPLSQLENIRLLLPFPLLNLIPSTPCRSFSVPVCHFQHRIFLALRFWFLKDSCCTLFKWKYYVSQCFHRNTDSCFTAALVVAQMGSAEIDMFWTGFK